MECHLSRPHFYTSDEGRTGLFTRCWHSFARLRISNSVSSRTAPTGWLDSSSIPALRLGGTGRLSTGAAGNSVGLILSKKPWYISGGRRDAIPNSHSHSLKLSISESNSYSKVVTVVIRVVRMHTVIIMINTSSNAYGKISLVVKVPHYTRALVQHVLLPYGLDSVIECNRNESDVKAKRTETEWPVHCPNWTVVSAFLSCTVSFVHSKCTLWSQLTISWHVMHINFTGIHKSNIGLSHVCFNDEWR